jgi:hypothetical protein
MTTSTKQDLNALPTLNAALTVIVDDALEAQIIDLLSASKDEEKAVHTKEECNVTLNNTLHMITPNYHLAGWHKMDKVTDEKLDDYLIPKALKMKCSVAKAKKVFMARCKVSANQWQGIGRQSSTWTKSGARNKKVVAKQEKAAKQKKAEKQKVLATPAGAVKQMDNHISIAYAVGAKPEGTNAELKARMKFIEDYAAKFEIELKN